MRFPKFRCYPWIYHQEVLRICQKLKEEEGFRDLDFVIYSKVSTSKDWTVTFKKNDYCSKPPAFSSSGGIL
jgi:hypothetical protein